MTRIDFYTHVDDKLKTACRLATKGFKRGVQIMVFCPDTEVAKRFDRALWTTPAISFIPHCFADDPLAPTTPVIVDPTGTEPMHNQVLINLRMELPAFFGRFQRLIEIVSFEDEDRLKARERYRFYRDRGYEIRTHDLSKANEEAETT